MTKKVFTTAYYLAKNDRPFTDHQELLELQEANGLSLGHGLKSRYSATEIVQHIAKQIRIKVCIKIIGVGGKISVLIDESTTLSTKTTLIVYLKCETDKSSAPSFMFLGPLEISDQGADTITKALLTCLETCGFYNDYLRANLVAFASDGASHSCSNRLLVK